MAVTVTDLAPVVAGEIPAPWAHPFVDPDTGAPYDLSGMTARVTWRINGGAVVTEDAEITGDNEATVTWDGNDHATAGIMRGELVVGNNEARYAQQFVRWIKSPTGATPLPEPGDSEGPTGDYLAVDGDWLVIEGDVLVMS